MNLNTIIKNWKGTQKNIKISYDKSLQLTIGLTVISHAQCGFSLKSQHYSMGVCIHWTGLLDWTTGLTFDLTFELFFSFNDQYCCSLARLR